eukprot:CAMPEP_0114116234 /NCGR_PEP_ID=MMETSP0043_2-20121206/4390_1 /TAXON_ID=464988 /ORGANISM="Hemiselmis andersenii, Strain CCMP644" /LENGTH=120 /DNA_ID=CAMNT_0001208543 /DNA_START=195 /DNA_END=553 /DNA_ORIENTATION=-
MPSKAIRAVMSAALPVNPHTAASKATLSATEAGSRPGRRVWMAVSPLTSTPTADALNSLPSFTHGSLVAAFPLPLLWAALFLRAIFILGPWSRSIHWLVASPIAETAAPCTQCVAVGAFA